MEGLFFEFSDRVWSLLQSFSYLFVDLRGSKVIFFNDCHLETVIFDHPERVETHDEGFEDGEKQFEIFGVGFGNRKDFSF